MLLIDTHTHIYDPDFDTDRAEVVQRAIDAGVGMMLLPNVDASTIQPMLKTHEQFPDCTRVMMGLQPEEVKGDYKQVLALMEKELERDIYIGVGEIGLDFYWDSTFEKEQLDAFETQLEWAKQLHLPLSIHCRKAFNQMDRILEKKQDGGLQDSECATLPLWGCTVSLYFSQALVAAFWSSHMASPAHDSEPVCRG